MSRTPLISGNWKMNLNHFEAIQIVQKLQYLVPSEVFDSVDVSLHPPFTDIRSVQTVIQADRMDFILGAQDCHDQDVGAFTGAVSPMFLAKLDVRIVIVGHSERREVFGETDDFVNSKVHAVLRHSMMPILCVGETLDERRSGSTMVKVLGQLTAGIAGLNADQVCAMVIAYEPIWAIGTGETATSADAQEVCGALRERVRQLMGDEAADAVRIQYGGSVKPGSIVELMEQPDVDGALVGGASLDPDDFARIVRFQSS